MVAEPRAEYGSLASRSRWLEESPDDTLDEVKRKEARFRGLVVSPPYRQGKRIADAWCAAFVQPRPADRDPAECITTDTLRGLETGPEALAPAQRDEIERLARDYQFFHWHLAFPEVFDNGGFDCVLGNPPVGAGEAPGEGMVCSTKYRDRECSERGRPKTDDPVSGR